MTRLNRRERINVLWVEDGAAVEVPHFTTPLFSSGRYNLVIAKDASDGFRWLTQPDTPFHVVVLDLHLAPGDYQFLIDRYQKLQPADGPHHPLGISILIDLLDPPSDGRGEKDAYAPASPEWLTPDRVGLLTVEPLSNVEGIMDRLGIDTRSFRQKSAMMPVTTLRELVDDIHYRRLSKDQSSSKY